MAATPRLVEFAWVVQRYRIDQVMMRRHYIRLGVGLAASLLVVAYNAFHLHASEALTERSRVAEWLVLIYLMACLMTVTVVGWRLHRSLLKPPRTLRLRVIQVVDFVHRWGSLLLLLTALGHGVVVVGTLLGLDILSPPGRVLLAALAPVILLIIHGLTQIPTTQRLCAIHHAAEHARSG